MTTDFESIIPPKLTRGIKIKVIIIPDSGRLPTSLIIVGSQVSRLDLIKPNKIENTAITPRNVINIG